MRFETCLIFGLVASIILMFGGGLFGVPAILYIGVVVAALTVFAALMHAVY